MLPYQRRVGNPDGLKWLACPSRASTHNFYFGDGVNHDLVPEKGPMYDAKTGKKNY